MWAGSAASLATSRANASAMSAPVAGMSGGPASSSRRTTSTSSASSPQRARAAAGCSASGRSSTASRIRSASAQRATRGLVIGFWRNARQAPAGSWRGGRRQQGAEQHPGLLPLTFHRAGAEAQRVAGLFSGQAEEKTRFNHLDQPRTRGGQRFERLVHGEHRVGCGIGRRGLVAECRQTEAAPAVSPRPGAARGPRRSVASPARPRRRSAVGRSRWCATNRRTSDRPRARVRWHRWAPRPRARAPAGAGGRRRAGRVRQRLADRRRARRRAGP